MHGCIFWAAGLEHLSAETKRALWPCVLCPSQLPVSSAVSILQELGKQTGGDVAEELEASRQLAVQITRQAMHVEEALAQAAAATRAALSALLSTAGGPDMEDLPDGVEVGRKLEPIAFLQNCNHTAEIVTRLLLCIESALSSSLALLRRLHLRRPPPDFRRRRLSRSSALAIVHRSSKSAMLLTLMGNMVSRRLHAFPALSRYVFGRALDLLGTTGCKPLP